MNRDPANKNAIPNSQPFVTVVEISDPTAAGEGIEVIDQDIVQLQSNPLRARRVILHLSRSLIVYQSTNLPVRTRTQVRDDLVAMVCFGPQAEGAFNGISVRPDLMLTAGPGTTGEFVVKSGYESLTVFLAPEELRMHLETRRLGGGSHVAQGVEMLQASAPAARCFFEWGKRFVDEAARQPDLFVDRPAFREAAQVELFETLMTALASTKVYEPTRKERTGQSQSRIIQIAEEFAETHTIERVSVTDLCEAADVSERTLQYAFQKVMGMTPVAFLTRLRLHRVRSSLRRSKYGTTTVSAEALNWGFWHFGDFSRAYKKCFFELPSETLRRTHDNDFISGDESDPSRGA